MRDTREAGSAPYAITPKGPADMGKEGGEYEAVGARPKTWGEQKEL